MQPTINNKHTTQTEDHLNNFWGKGMGFDFFP
jgi:hypothetical protein